MVQNVYNLYANLLGSYYGTRFGKMIRRRKIRILILGIGREVLAVARAKGVNLEPLGEKLNVEFLLDEKGSPLWCKHMIIRFIGFIHRKTESAMLADIRACRKTEIEYLNALIKSYGEEKVIDTPLNTKVVKLVEKLESGSLKPSLDNIRYFERVQFHN